jgi:hypothetical protein
VNNAVVGERIRSPVIGAPRGATRLEWLKSSEPRHRKVGNGRGDSRAREGPAATSGEKPLKGGAHGRSGMKYGREIRDTGRAGRGKPGRSAWNRKVTRDDRVSAYQQASKGPNGRVFCRVDEQPRKRRGESPRGRRAAAKAAWRVALYP